MYEWLEAAKVCLSLFFLSLSSWQDYKKREVSNRIWLLFAPSGLAFSLLQFYFTTNQSFILFMGLSLLVVTGVSLALFYLGLFGGADAKALICLSLALPVYPSYLNPYLNVISPLFSLSILSNAVLFSSVLIFGMVLFNLYRRFRVGEKLFEGLEDEPLWNKILVFVTGFRIDINKLGNSPHLIPLETISRGENGKGIRRLKIFFRLSEDSTQETGSLNDFYEEIEGKIWVTPSLPFLIFITIGFVAALFLGDVLIWLVAQIVNIVYGL